MLMEAAFDHCISALISAANQRLCPGPARAWRALGESVQAEFPPDLRSTCLPFRLTSVLGRPGRVRLRVYAALQVAGNLGKGGLGGLQRRA